MSRYFLIQGIEKPLELSDEDLPFSLGGAECHLVLEGIDSVIGYIGDMDGHLFFQAVAPDIVVFHNDTEVSGSVWLKSGDTLSIGSEMYQFTVSGDRYTFTHSHISVKDGNHADSLSTTEHQASQSKNNHEIDYPVQSPAQQPAAGRRWLWFSCSILGILLLASLFVLFATPVKIAISPEPDHIDIKGFPPAISFGEKVLFLPGSYTVVFEKQGYLPESRDIDVMRNETNSFSFQMEKLPGILSVQTHPQDGVKISVDGEELGETPLPETEIAPGEYTLTFDRELYFPVTRQVEIEGMGKIQQIEVTLQPGWFTLQLESEPPGAEVYSNGKSQGVTPVELQLFQGTHTLELRKAEFVTELAEISGTAGSSLHEKLRLRPSPAEIMLTSSPAGASVLVNGSYSGISPVQLTLEPDKQHSLTLQAPGYKPLKAEYTFARAETKNIELTLNPELGTVFFQIEPPTAKLFLDGTQQTRATGRFRLPARKTKVVVTHPAYEKHQAVITPNKAFSQNISITLRKPGEKVKNEPQDKPQKKTQLSHSGKKMILITPEDFTMGAPRREAGRRANEQQLKVAMRRPFYASAQLVTNKEYKRFRPEHSSGKVGSHSLDGDNQPVVNITRNDAAAYLNWLSAQEGYPAFYIIDGDSVKSATPGNTGYRLLSEAEWAYIARKSKRQVMDKFPWSGTYPPMQPTANFSDISSRQLTNLIISNYNDYFAVSSPVGSFPPNAAGFYDIGGNVAEWCHDYYSAYRTAKEADPFGPSQGILHVIRGSGWRDYSVTELRLSYRRYHNKPQDDVGFRVARYAQ